MKNLEKKVAVSERLVHKYVDFISSTYSIGGHYTSKISKKKIGHYGFIPNSTGYVMNTLILLYDHIYADERAKHISGYCRRIRFLDIGCGIGNIVEMARLIGFDAYGLEYNTKIYNIAKRFVGSRSINNDVSSPRAIKGNMLIFKNYHEYDVLYYYEPMADRQAMLDFANRLAREMRVGAYVMPYGANPFREDMESFKKVSLKGEPGGEFTRVYKKIAEVQGCKKHRSKKCSPKRK